MSWSLLTWILILAGTVLVVGLAQLIYLSGVLSWEDRKTVGLAYYGLPPAERERFRRALRRHAVLLYPILRIMPRPKRFDFARVSFRHRGVSGPRGTCSKESFERADRYEPRAEDVFVVTQMKCGTTWMQHVVYQILRRGDGDLVESGTALYAVSPWLEARKSVSVDEAPTIGTERPSRIIKTHLPASLCPFSPGSRYIYVTRHPASCFASCVDFLAENTGAFGPSLDRIEEWFCSPELMWWGTWPAHVRGWWEIAGQRDNVLWVRFEAMKRDLGAVVRQVTSFLGVAPLTDGEVARVLHKCSFAYMQQHKGNFEMHPPHILAVDAELFVRGTADRQADVPEQTRRRILDWCEREMVGSGLSLDGT